MSHLAVHCSARDCYSATKPCPERIVWSICAALSHALPHTFVLIQDDAKGLYTLTVSRAREPEDLERVSYVAGCVAQSASTRDLQIVIHDRPMSPF